LGRDGWCRAEGAGKACRGLGAGRGCGGGEGPGVLFRGDGESSCWSRWEDVGGKRHLSRGAGYGRDPWSTLVCTAAGKQLSPMSLGSEHERYEQAWG